MHLKMNNTNLELFKTAHLIRASQEILIEKYHPEDLMRCPIHFCQGQEALCSALSLEIKKNDYLCHNYYPKRWSHLLF